MWKALLVPALVIVMFGFIVGCGDDDDDNDVDVPGNGDNGDFKVNDGDFESLRTFIRTEIEKSLEGALQDQETTLNALLIAAQNADNSEELMAIHAALVELNTRVSSLDDGKNGDGYEPPNGQEPPKDGDEPPKDGEKPPSNGFDGDKPSWLGSQCVLAPAIRAINSTVTTLFTSPDSLAYPDPIAPDPGRSGALFPDTDIYGYPPRAGYEESSEDANYFEDCFGDIDVPQFYYRVNTAGYFWIPAEVANGEDIMCMANEEKGCALIMINHFGPTMKVNGVYVDNGFTYFGRVWNMEQPHMVTEAAQSLIDHVVYRMIYGDTPQTGFNDGTNCGSIDGCRDVEWHITVWGNNQLLKHWAGLYQPN